MFIILGDDGRQYGPVDAGRVRQWVTEKRAVAQTRAQVVGTTEWKPLAAFPEFSDLFSPSTVSAPPRAPVVVKRQNPLATAGLVLGLLGLTIGCCCGFPFAVAGLICSGVGLAQISREPFYQTGRGIGLAGLFISIGALFMTTIGWILFLIPAILFELLSR